MVNFFVQKSAKGKENLSAYCDDNKKVFDNYAVGNESEEVTLYFVFYVYYLVVVTVGHGMECK